LLFGMRRTFAVIVCVLALAVPAGNVWGATQAKSAQKKKVVTVSRATTGPLIDVSRWGQLQVSIKVNVTTTTVGTKKSKSFKVMDITYPVYPNHTDRSAYISQQALPLLRQEVLQLKGSSIQLVSGATDTSYAFVDAIRGALAKAGA
jgi:uncharacterized protein with FMN-binding domain